MARNIGPKCRECRTENMQLFLKGDKCETGKCPIIKKKGIPGQHKRLMKKPSEYSGQLRAKQQVKKAYGVMERQFRKYFAEASRHKGMTGFNLLLTLELRLDNVVRKLGFATSPSQARQLVLHKNVRVNDRVVNIPSYAVKMNDKIQVAEKRKENPHLKQSLATSVKKGIPVWLSLDASTLSGTVIRHPLREEMSVPYDAERPKEQLIVELYSK
jgi:small subunit ribosomal protein S4